MSVGISRSECRGSDLGTLAGFFGHEDIAALVLARTCLQARWGSLRSWQLGHSERPVGVRKSWLRRFAVRCLEWRRFGLGIAVSLSIGRGGCAKKHAVGEAKNLILVLQLELIGQTRKRIPSRIGGGLIAGAFCLIQVLTTARAKPFAVCRAEGATRQGE